MKSLRSGPLLLAALFAASSLLHVHAHGGASESGGSSHVCPLAVPAAAAGAAPSAQPRLPAVFELLAAAEAARPAAAAVVPPPSRAPPSL